jgi:hypothetical protein
MKYTMYIVILFLGLLIYTGCVLTKKSVLIEEPTTAEYTPEKVVEAEIPEVPELSVEEITEVQENIKVEAKEIVEELDIEKKSVEQMRDDVHEILDEIIETDDTVDITFNMTYKMQD